MSSRFTYARLSIMAVFIAAAAACIQFSAYRFPATLSLVVKGPVPNSYSIYLDYGVSGEELDKWSVSVGAGDGFRTVVFDIPDRRIYGVGLGLGLRPGSVLIREAALKGPFREITLKPRDLIANFVPADKAAAEGSLSGDSLLLQTSGDGITLRSSDPDFSRNMDAVNRPRALMSAAVLAVSLLLLLFIADTRRLIAYLSLLTGILAYLAVRGAADIVLPVSGGLLAVSFAELALYRKRLALVFMGLFLAIFLAESVFIVKEKFFTHVPIYKTEEDGPFWLEPDPLQGYKPVPNIKYTESKSADGEYVYRNITYTLDGKGRRASAAVPGAARHAIFFGCSYTLGLGVQDGETMPSRFQDIAGGEYQAYNYAFTGWGPGHAYNVLRDGSLFDDVAQDEGIAVYGFVGDQIYRSTPMFTKYYNDFPVFRLDREGRLEGPFKVYEKEELRRWRRLFGPPDGILYKASPTLRYFLGMFPSWPESRAERVKATEKIILECKKLYDSRFKGEFYVLVWDREALPDEYVDLLTGMLKEDGIPVLIQPPVPDPADKHLPLDPHPTPNRHRWAAQKLYEFIGGRPADGASNRAAL